MTAIGSATNVRGIDIGSYLTVQLQFFFFATIIIVSLLTSTYMTKKGVIVIQHGMGMLCRKKKSMLHEELFI